MNLTKSQLILLAIAGLFIITLGLVFAGVFPGLKKGPDKGPKITGTIEFWGVFDLPTAYEEAIRNFNTTYTDVKINYRAFENKDSYDQALLEAFASQKGPDVFMIPNSGLPKYLNKISPAHPQIFGLAKLRELFPQIVEQNFTSQGIVYALPISIDTLALLYNKDLFNGAGIVFPPTTWEDLKNLIPKLVKRTSTTQITRAAVALGGSEKSIDAPADILSLLMLQTGTKMVNDEFTEATFGKSPEAENAFKFYLQFSDAGNESYTWNDTLPKDLDAFADEKVAMIFTYASNIPALTEKNSFLNFGVAQMPQPKSAAKTITYPHYFGYTVSLQSKISDLAWQFVVALTTDERNGIWYSNTTKKPPALLNLLNQLINDGTDHYLDIFSRGVLTARSWPQIDPDAINVIFSSMIESVLLGRETVTGALQNAEQKITERMQQKLF